MCRENDCTESIATLLNEQFRFHHPVLHDPDQANRILVRRSHIWQDAVRAFSRTSFDPHKCIRITFIGEEAVDDGGPRREFLSLAVQELAEDGNIFQGPQHSRFLVHNVQALASRKFYYAGLLVANGGPGLTCLAEALYTYLSSGIHGIFNPDLSLIPDLEIQESLEQVSLLE